MTKINLLTILLSAVLTACTTGLKAPPSTETGSPAERGTSTPALTGQPSETPEHGLDLEKLGNLEYPLEYPKDGKAKLVDGEFREQAAPDSATETIIKLSDFYAFGKRNGSPAAAVVLVSDPGGSGTFYDLALVVYQDGTPTVLGTAYLGDRVNLEGLEFADEEIVVEMVVQAEDDPMARPTRHVRNTYHLEGDRLELKMSESIPQAKPSEESENQLMGETWQWVRFTNPLQEIEVPDPENYALEFLEGGDLRIKADCNHAAGSYVLEGSTIKIEIGPSTLAACPPGSLSDQFLKDLGFVGIYFFQEGNLFLDLFADGGTMQFEPGISDP